VVLEQRDVRVRARERLQRGLDRAPGGVGGVQHPAVAVSALAREVVIGVLHRAGRAVIGAGESDAPVDQPLDAGARVIDGILDDCGIT
jgi:hypothetical protein